MDIDLLAKMVKKLILDSDKVVLPGLGCFVAEVVPATFSDKGYTINPPYRKLYFRSKPDEGDELVAFYAKTNNLPLDVAEEVLKDFLTEMKSVLFIKKTVVFPGLGRLRATKENDMFFVADEDLDIYPGGFGLEPISLKSHQESREEVSAAVSDLKSILVEPAPISVPDPIPVPTLEPLTEPEVAAELAPSIEPISAESVSAEPSLESVVETESDSVPDFKSSVESSDESDVEVAETESKWQMCLEEVWENVKTYSSRVCRWLRDPKRRTAVMVVGGVLAVVVAFFLIVAFIANVFPSWMDAMLYSNEELEILNQIYE